MPNRIYTYQICIFGCEPCQLAPLCSRQKKDRSGEKKQLHEIKKEKRATSKVGRG